LIEKNIVSAVCNVSKNCRTEKIVRVCIHFVIGVLPDENALEIIIEESIVSVLTLLEYEKWRDNEMYEEIRDSLHNLNQQIKKRFSNFSRYNLELDKKKLKWSFLHSEKFWHENVMQFEENEFEAVKKLANLLKSEDSSTVCVACHDLGEFARLHPTGKRICQRLQVKDTIMALMLQSKDREVAREALLACQKLMLQYWEEVAAKPS